MKERRQARIIELIQTHTVTTQDELQSLLENSGYFATQATISRDIKELRLIKVLSPGGIYYYTQSNSIANETFNFNGENAYLKSIRSVEACNNFVVIKTYTAMASAVCEAIDSSNRSEIVGTIAGENTIFVMLRNENYSEQFAQSLKESISRIK